MEFRIFNRNVRLTHKELIKLCLLLLIYTMFLIWVKSLLGIVVIPFIVDAYTTRFIPWNWWKKSENAFLRKVMSWVDAIVFALVAVYFVHLYLFQNYVIPTSSLEKSLLVGDYLFVSKFNYGPRKPQTPLSMPLTQHTMPVLGGKSYTDIIQWDYERVPGLEDIKMGDIVVFNYPAGDIATTNPEVIDLHSICYGIGRELDPDNDPTRLPADEAREVYAKQYRLGMDYVKEHPEVFGKIQFRPVDRRENYVKRCVGLPGNILQIKDKVLYIDGEPVEQPENVQFNYHVELTQSMPEYLRRELDISMEDLATLYHTGQIPLTQANYEKLKNNTRLVKNISIVNHETTQGIYPLNGNTGWTIDNYGPVWIPQRGESVKLTADNIAIYERAIADYEGNTLEVKDGKIFINGEERDSYTFNMDYYWMMGDNRHNSADSRCWGFVPEDHIVGKPLFVWLSLDKDRSLFDGKIRWERIFRSVSSLD